MSISKETKDVLFFLAKVGECLWGQQTDGTIHPVLFDPIKGSYEDLHDSQATGLGPFSLHHWNDSDPSVGMYGFVWTKHPLRPRLLWKLHEAGQITVVTRWPLPTLPDGDPTFASPDAREILIKITVKGLQVVFPSDRQTRLVDFWNRESAKWHR